MSDNAIILDLLSRIIKLEDEVEKLKKERRYEYTAEDLIEKKESEIPAKEPAKRSELRSEIIEKLKKNNPDKKRIRVANRNEGSGITVEEKDGSKKSYVLRTSNNIASDKSQGWFTVGELLVDKIINKELNGLILYSYYDDPEKNIVIIMNSEEFEGYMNEKGLENKDASGKYHLYIENRDDSVFEVRDGDVDLSEYSNKFKI